jgi:hypothetical protein
VADGEETGSGPGEDAPTDDERLIVAPFQSRADGQLHFEPATAGATFPVTAPEDATPLEEDEPEGVIPPSPLWAMKDRRHEQWFHFGHPERIRVCLGSGDAAVYAIDDGSHHCMIGRRVGATLDGCVYSLAGSDAGLSGTVEAPGVSNIFDVDYYEHAEEIPDEYLPPSPFIEFVEDLPTSDR